MSVPFNLILIFNSYSIFLIKHLVFRWSKLKGSYFIKCSLFFILLSVVPITGLYLF